MSAHIKLPLETSRLTIDEFTPSDYKRLKEIATNINKKADEDRKNGYMPFYAFQVDKDAPGGEKEVAQKVSEFIIKAAKEKEEEPRTTYRMAIRLKEGEDKGLLIGNITVNMLPVEENGKLVYGDQGYFLDPAYGGKGYADEASRRVSHEFFKYYDTMDITAHPDNAGSRKLIKKSGGQQVGFIDSTGYGKDEPRAVFKTNKKDFYNTSAFATLAKNQWFWKALHNRAAKNVR